MPITDANPEARAIITGKNLIGTDVDRTLLATDNTNEEYMFLNKVAPLLTIAASEGSHLAFVTANSMEQLTGRVLRMLVKQLCHIDDLALIDNFHFFCNSGGVYAHFSKEDKEIKRLIDKKSPNVEEVMDVLTVKDVNGLAIHPRYIDADYIERCRIPENEENTIKEIMDTVAARYIAELKSKSGINDNDYKLSGLKDKEGNWIVPKTNLRHVVYGKDGDKKASTQITLKPLLSYKHAKSEELANKLFNTSEDLRNIFTGEVQSMLIKKGLGHHISRPGGTSSIDDTLERLDKAYAMQFLIDRLNIQGSVSRDEEFGSNAIYFGDEVMVGDKGNDYAVTKIPGLLVFAVNADRSRVPYRSNIIIPSDVIDGPDATAAMLAKFNECAATLLATYGQTEDVPMTALEYFKRNFFIEQIDNRLSNLKNFGGEHYSAKDLQAINNIFGLVGNPDPAQAKVILGVINQNSDIIMEKLSNQKAPLRAIAASCPCGRTWREHHI